MDCESATALVRVRLFLGWEPEAMTRIADTWYGNANDITLEYYLLQSLVTNYKEDSFYCHEHYHHDRLT